MGISPGPSTAPSPVPLTAPSPIPFSWVFPMLIDRLNRHFTNVSSDPKSSICLLGERSVFESSQVQRVAKITAGDRSIQQCLDSRGFPTDYPQLGEGKYLVAVCSSWSSQEADKVLAVYNKQQIDKVAARPATRSVTWCCLEINRPCFEELSRDY